MKRLLTILTGLAISAATLHAQLPNPSYEIMGKDTTCNIFFYSPGPTSGLHVAYLTDGEQWQDLGRLSVPDFKLLGTPSTMYNPYVFHAADGTWRLLYGVNDSAPCFGAVYSDDIVSWRHQVYPKMKEEGVTKPVMFQMDDGSFDIYLKLKDGTRRYVKADKALQHFNEFPEASSISDDAWLMDTATVDNKLCEGNMFEVPKLQLDYLELYFQAVANDNKQCSESMTDDGSRFATIGNSVNATLTVDPSKTKVISDKLIGFSLGNHNIADGYLDAELLRRRGSKEKTLLAKSDTLYNSGWHDIVASPSEQFDFSASARPTDGKKNQLLVALIGENGQEYVKEKLKLQEAGWQHFSLPLVIDKDAEKSKVVLAITPLKDGQVELDSISLLPHETFKGHGLRKDVAEKIAALHPKFIEYNPACGLSEKQYKQLCEDVGADAMPAFDEKDESAIDNYYPDLLKLKYSETPGWYMHHEDYYDSFDRKGKKVFVVGWDSHGETMENALAEALHLCSLERNGDIVKMACYTPTDDSIVAQTPDYFTQQLWGSNSGDVYVESKVSADSLTYRIGASVVKDANGKTIIKLVNALPVPITLNIVGVQIPDGTPFEGFSGKPGDKKVTTVKSSVSSQKITIPAYSVIVTL